MKAGEESWGSPEDVRPIDAMTDDERVAEVERLLRIAADYGQHAEELERYLAERQARGEPDIT